MIDVDGEIIDELEKSLGLKFKNRSMLQTALTHRSILNEKRLKEESSELEWLIFLGADLFWLILTDRGFRRICQDPGRLSQLISKIAQTGLAMEVINRYGLLDFYTYKSNMALSDSVMWEMLSAFLAVVYLEHGYKTAVDLLEPSYFTQLKKLSSKSTGDWKTPLQEWVQQKGGTPSYRVIGEVGPEHDKFFNVEVKALNKTAQGVGRSKKAAEQAAANEYFNSYIPPGERKRVESEIECNKYEMPKREIQQQRIKELSQIREVFPANINLIHTSLVHSSYCHENRSYGGSYLGPLACLGSKVQTFVYAKFLYDRHIRLNIIHPSSGTAAKAFLVNQTINAMFCDRLDITRFIWIGKGQRRTGIPDSIKEDAFQALFGAVFLSNNADRLVDPFDPLKQFMDKFIFKICLDFKREDFDPKTVLQEKAQRENWHVSYKHQMLKDGHQPEFLGTVIVTNGDSLRKWSGKGNSVKQATERAARKALKSLQYEFDSKSRHSEKKVPVQISNINSCLDTNSRQLEQISKDIRSIIYGISEDE